MVHKDEGDRQAFCFNPMESGGFKETIDRKIGKMPSTMGQFRVYFSRAHAKLDGGTVYVDAFVQQSIPILDIKGDTEWMIKENKIGNFNKILQVESTLQMGWLLYSINALGLKILANILTDDFGVQVELRHTYISADKHEPDREERKKWMSTHIEVDTNDREKGVRRLATIYGS